MKGEKNSLVEHRDSEVVVSSRVEIKDIKIKILNYCRSRMKKYMVPLKLKKLTEKCIHHDLKKSKLKKKCSVLNQ